KRHGMGNMLIKKANGAHTVGIVVGEILDDRLACGLLANYNEKFTKHLKNTKNTFILTHPHVTGFGEDFDHFYCTMLAVQGNISSTKDD
ncbi:hypothetical protein L208DRAFT_1300143, partial [Tricholoma matsutake]